MRTRKVISHQIAALKVHQWLAEWNKVPFDPVSHRREPEHNFYMFSLPASYLKALSGIYRRSAKGGIPRTQDLGIQRRHDEARSKTIAEFIQYGYPWSDLGAAKRQSGRFDDLRKPGWLPTAIVVNILKAGDKRRGRTVNNEDLISIRGSDEQMASILLPNKFSGSDWRPSDLHPIEVIDGQHRLWAFEEDRKTEDYELPVVAFYGLDISWQAYLFWTINIKPKRINASLAFDLYPLLRTEDWLERFEGHSIYRETRAQELVEAVWVHPESPWYQWINMLGESGLKKSMVTQAAWVRALVSTFVKSWEGRGVHGLGGLFGARVGKDKEVLPWSRAQQAAFLILIGQKFRDAIQKCNNKWAIELRKVSLTDDTLKGLDPAFYGPYTLLTTDQGIRGFLIIANDILYERADVLSLASWQSREDASAIDEKAVSNEIKSLRNQKVEKFISRFTDCLATYDWRSSSAPGLTDSERTLKAAFRGSGGYRELRRQLLKHLSKQPGDVGNSANNVMTVLGI